VEALQAALDGWVVEYNNGRPHQSCGNRPPVERFALAERSIVAVDQPALVCSPVPFSWAGVDAAAGRGESLGGRQGADLAGRVHLRSQGDVRW